MTLETKMYLRRLLDTEEENGNIAAPLYAEMTEQLESTPIVEAVEYRFFWGGVEYQLMSFPDEDLIGVYNTGHRTSLDQAVKDIRDDMEDRNIRTATLNIDTSKG